MRIPVVLPVGDPGRATGASTAWAGAVPPQLEFKAEWDGRHYGVQQVVPVVAEEEECLVVVTVYVFYFQEGEER